jgi:hypothetical protein
MELNYEEIDTTPVVRLKKETRRKEKNSYLLV